MRVCVATCHCLCVNPIKASRVRHRKARTEGPTETTKKVKIVLLGASGVGKTTLFRRLMGDLVARHESTCDDSSPPPASTSVNIGAKLMHLEGMPPVVIEVWDVPSQLFAGEAMLERYVSGAQGIALVYSLESELHQERSWQLVRTFLERNELPAVVVGTKRDATTATCSSSTRAIHAFCEQLNVPHMEISAIESAVEPLRVAKALLERIKHGQESEVTPVDHF